MSAVRARVGMLCDQIARHVDMEQAIRDAGAGTQLVELLDAVRQTDPPDADRLGALLDLIEHACARKGLAGITAATKQYTPLPGAFGRNDAAEPEPPTWICPLGRCGRTVFDDEVDAPPVCAAGGGVRMKPIKVL